MQLSLKRHPYRLVRDGVTVAMFSNYVLAMNTGDMRRRLEKEASPNATQASWFCEWGTERYAVKRIVQQKETIDEIDGLATALIQ